MSTATPARPLGLMRSYLELCRASNLPTVWTNTLAAVLLARRGEPFSAGALGAALAVGAALSLFYLGGMALNDVLDVEEDRRKKPQRPIPSGRISGAGAAVFASSLFGAGMALLLSLCGALATLSGLLLIGVIYLYDRLHSRSAATVLLMAACRALVFITASLAVSGKVNQLVIYAAAAQFLYIVGLTAVARWEKARERSFHIPPIPWMLAAISLIDGVVMSLAIAPLWLLAGVAGAATTRLLQTQVRGD